MKWLILLVLLLLVAFAIGVRAGRSSGGGTIAFQPVRDLEPATRAGIEEALAQGRAARAIRIYRDATGAGQAAATAAVEQHRRGPVR